MNSAFVHVGKNARPWSHVPGPMEPPISGMFCDRRYGYLRLASTCFEYLAPTRWPITSQSNQYLGRTVFFQPIRQVNTDSASILDLACMPSGRGTTTPSYLIFSHPSLRGTPALLLPAPCFPPSHYPRPGFYFSSHFLLDTSSTPTRKSFLPTTTPSRALLSSR